MQFAVDKNQSRIHIDEAIVGEEYYCPCCGETYIERPDCFEEGKQYLKWIIDRVRSGDKGFELTLQCHPTTIYRWKKRRE